MEQLYQPGTSCVFELEQQRRSRVLLSCVSVLCQHQHKREKIATYLRLW